MRYKQTWAQWDPSQARTIHQYKNLKTKVQKCCADIYFNKQCLATKITPNYANIKIPVASPASRVTQGEVHTIRLKDEIKYLHLKKEKLNKTLYTLHLQAAQKTDFFRSTSSPTTRTPYKNDK
jgi:hypothetical protein